MVGPKVTFITTGHPVDPEERRLYLRVQVTRGRLVTPAPATSGLELSRLRHSIEERAQPGGGDGLDQHEVLFQPVRLVEVPDVDRFEGGVADQTPR